MINYNEHIIIKKSFKNESQTNSYFQSENESNTPINSFSYYCQYI